jgi:hypothetical protein
MNIQKDGLDVKESYSSPVLMCHGRVGSKTQGSSGSNSDSGGSKALIGNPGGGGGNPGGGGGNGGGGKGPG